MDEKKLSLLLWSNKLKLFRLNQFGKKMFLLNLWNPDQVKKMARVFQVANWSLKKAILLLINNLDAGHDVRTVLNWYMKENWSDHKD